jgi:hypothetical protein
LRRRQAVNRSSWAAAMIRPSVSSAAAESW